MEKGSVEIFGLSVGLGMSYQGEVLFDPQILAPCLERVVRKLLFIVRDDDPRETKAIDDTLPEEFLNSQAGYNP